MESTPANHGLSRRDALKVGGGALALAVTGSHGAAAPAEAQTPKRGGVLRLTVQADPLHFDPHQTISFVTMVPLSLVYSRLVKVKAGPSVRPMTYPVEPDLAESWTQTNDTTYVFKLRKGVRWHPKPPVNGRELTADDVKYTYERFLTITGNPNKPVLEYVDRIEAVDKYTVKFTLKEPNAWFLDLLASTSTWIVAKECVEKFGDLKKVESVVGTGPWMLERWEPNVKLVYVRNPNYFVPGLPYADGVDMLIDKDPSSRLATWLSGKTDFGPEYQHAVRWLDAPLARQRKPGLQTAEYTWFTSGAIGFKLAQPALRRRPGPAGAGARHQHRRGVRVSRLLPGALDAQPDRPCRLRRVVDPDRSARTRGQEALRVQHRARPSASSPRPATRTDSRPRSRRPRRSTGPTSTISCRSRSRTGRRPASTPT